MPPCARWGEGKRPAQVCVTAGPRAFFAARRVALVGGPVRAEADREVVLGAADEHRGRDAAAQAMGTVKLRTVVPERSVRVASSGMPAAIVAKPVSRGVGEAEGGPVLHARQHGLSVDDDVERRDVRHRVEHPEERGARGRRDRLADRGRLGGGISRVDPLLELADPDDRDPRP